MNLAGANQQNRYKNLNNFLNYNSNRMQHRRNLKIPNRGNNRNQFSLNLDHKSEEEQIQKNIQILQFCENFLNKDATKTSKQELGAGDDGSAGPARADYDNAAQNKVIIFNK